MNCWEFLELEPTSNKRAIKKAYAKLLKQYKPDEHPEEFQQLNEAYKEALYWSTEIAEEESPPPSSTQIDSHKADSEQSLDELTLDLSYQQSPEKKQSSYFVNEDDEAIDFDKYEQYESDIIDEHHANPALPPIDEEKLKALLERIQSCITENRFPSPEKLSFLKAEPMLLDWDFNNLLGAEILKLVALSLTAENKKNHLGANISNSTLKYLNDVFAWDSNPYLLYNHLEYEVAEDILEKLENSNHSNEVYDSVKGGNRLNKYTNEIYKAEKFERFFAFLIDITIAAILTGLLTLMVPSILKEPKIHLAFISCTLVLYWAVCVVFEAISSLPSSPGKHIFRLAVVDLNLQPITLLKSVGRTLIQALKIYWGYILIFNDGDINYLWLFIWVFATGILDEKQLFQDKFTKTIVIRNKGYS